MSSAEYMAMLDTYASTPSHGDVVTGTGGLRKGRIAKENSGKSGGYRAFSLFLDRSVPVYLLWLIDKTDEENITSEQKKVFKTIIGEIRKELGR